MFWPVIAGWKKLRAVSFGRCTFSISNSSFSQFSRTEHRKIVAKPENITPLRGEIPQEVEELANQTPFAVWDETHNHLRCFSHPLGRGTFFYCWLNGCLLISTSLPDIATVLEDVQLDRQMVLEYFVLIRNTSCDQKRTFIRGINQLPPGHCLEWVDNDLRIFPYWSPQSDSQVEKLSLSEAVEYVRSAIEKTIDGVRPVAKVGCLVSGGLDSSVVAALVQQRQRAIGSDAILLTLGHDIDCPEERQLQHQLAEYLHAELVVPSQNSSRLQLEPLRTLNSSANAPCGGLFTGIYTAMIKAAADRGITVLFGGEGGDEVFTASPHILADFILKHEWGAALQALGFFTSLDADSNSLQVLASEGLLPILSSSPSRIGKRVACLTESSLKGKTRNHHNLAFLARLLGESPEELNGVNAYTAEDFCHRRASGLSFATYSSYRQVLEIPFYEAAWPYYECGSGTGVRIVNPLADVNVFRAAMSLRLDQRVGTWVGFRPKRLLRLAAGDSIPQELSFHPKVGVSNLVAQMTQGLEDELIEILRSGRLEEIGINPDPHLSDPRNVPASVSLYWALLLVLTVWFEELKNGVAQRRG